ncbi:Gfo/Idh/MocA family oxidoreductase [Phenylobacterium sp.]|uniref:Gfo/Idh/MocA family protein n=1 Tax=Phenylobacterium sp. TaxID=1871053 RepID=UPI0012007291|nr:Gfo/Idh/MocA family oxidoreductase [Phenylobacterium sp.]THD70974.1 MAG: inositol 2-dehydrogenase [Phenylobacterium sp.]
MHRIAQIGAGRMGAVHLANAARNPRLEVVWLVDPRPDAQAIAASAGARIASVDQVLADASIEGVVVASSTDTHLALVKACLAAGKAVFCEKPLDLSLASVLAAEPELGHPKTPLFVAFNRHFDPQVRGLRAKIAAGEIGDLETLQVISHDPAPPPANFIPTSGGLFKDFAIHDLDMACWLMPDPIIEVFAWASCLVDPAIAKAGDVDTARTLLRDARGRLCSISNTRRSGCGYDQRVEAFGSTGMASAGDLVTDSVQVWREAGPQTAPRHKDFISRYAKAYSAEIDHFADMLAGAAQPETGYADSVRSLRLAEAAAHSVAIGAPVRLQGT